MHFSPQPSPSDQRLPAIGSVQWTGNAESAITACPPRRAPRSLLQPRTAAERAGAPALQAERSEPAAEQHRETALRTPEKGTERRRAPSPSPLRLSL
ncbi:hypothetical protein ANANG_G00064170 [Anguilla anguilla]|uniref:Uncharacterized protein n=1 Tax=Anguilla anguilla TaxID=7936 RepID=A0A9D3MTQ7_ANGAN|nr:hypothetical protein ANANG_G00064170 [Anguilla anguilla]